MAAPVVERIAVAIETRLSKVTENNGYQLTVSKVSRPKKIEDYSAQDKLVRLVMGDAEKVAIWPGNPCKIHWLQTFVIAVYVMLSDNAAVSDPETQLNLMRASVEKGIATPETVGDDWAKWGPVASALAVNSEFNNPRPFTTADGRYDAIAINLDVEYRTPENDPFTSAA